MKPCDFHIERYLELQDYVAWNDADAALVTSVKSLIEAQIPAIVDDFYDEVSRHSATLGVLAEGPQQIERLKLTLQHWLREFLSGPYDSGYVQRRWQVGQRHAEIGLQQRYVGAAMSRLRRHLNDAVRQSVTDVDRAAATMTAINKLLDIDLALIVDAYETEHVAQQMELQRLRSESRFRQLVESASCVVVILKPDLTIAYFSPFGEELTGRRLDDVVGAKYLRKFVPEEHQAAAANVLQAAFDGDKIDGFESPILRRGGERRWLFWNIRRIDDSDVGAVVLAVGHDVTERREAQEQLLRSERLAGIGQMITGIAHEGRNALQRIQSAVEMLELELKDRPAAGTLVTRLLAAQDDLRRLFDEVRNYASPIQLERSVCDLATVWREAFALVRDNQRTRDAVLGERAATVNTQVVADRFRLVQVFRNLFENSFAACKQEIRLEIECRSAELDSAPALAVVVRDNGSGLTAEVARMVFEPFFTTKTRGTGLGMAIARRVVEAHGGRIEVGRLTGTGAEFVLKLPR